MRRYGSASVSKRQIVGDEVEHLRGERTQNDGEQHAYTACDEKSRCP